MEGQETTEEYRLGKLEERLNTGVLLHAWRHAQCSHSHALSKVQTTIGGEGSDWVLQPDLPPRLWKVTYAGERLQLLSSDRNRPAMRNGEPFLHGELRNGERFCVAEFEIEVMGLAPKQVLLEALSAPHLGSKWALSEGETILGRSPDESPEESDSLAFQDSTVSRRHARLSCQRGGSTLEALSTRSDTRVNGELVCPGTHRELVDGDVIGLGRLLLRYRHELPQVEGAPTLRVQSLGSFCVSLGGKEIPQDAWQGPLVRYAFALLTTQRHHPLSEERLVTLLWGDEDVSRKRLYNIISHLRGMLRQSTLCSVDPILRDGRGYRLNPHLPVWHDLEEVEEGLSTLQRAVSRQNVPAIRHASQQILKLYQGPYLDGCQLNWAEIRRAQLESQWAAGLTGAAEFLLDHERDLARTLAERVLAVDGLCERAYLVMARLHQSEGNLREALRFLELAGSLLEKATLQPSLDFHHLRQELTAAN